MKLTSKLTGAFLAATIIMTSAAQSFADSNLYEQSDDYLFDSAAESLVSEQSLIKFNEFIAQLDDETAELILSDEELVNSMKLESYWETDGATDTEVAPYASVTLPLSSFPAGSYFSVDGSACTCHGSCDFDDHSGFSKSRCYEAAYNRSGNCRRYSTTRSIQCKGFADYVFYKYNGVDCSDSNSINKSLSHGSVTASNLKNYIKNNLSVGAHLRFSLIGYDEDGKQKNAGPHSIIITKITNTGISYYQANYGGRCLVTTDTKTWSQLSSWIYSVTNAWTL